MPDKPTPTPQPSVLAVASFGPIVPRIRSSDLFAGETEILIQHRGCAYLLSIQPDGELHLAEIK